MRKCAITPAVPSRWCQHHHTVAGTIFVQILENKGTDAQNNVVISNAALAIQCFNPAKSLADVVAEARESLTSGKALNKLNKLIELQ